MLGNGVYRILSGNQREDGDLCHLIDCTRCGVRMAALNNEGLLTLLKSHFCDPSMVADLEAARAAIEVSASYEEQRAEPVPV